MFQYFVLKLLKALLKVKPLNHSSITKWITYLIWQFLTASWIRNFSKAATDLLTRCLLGAYWYVVYRSLMELLTCEVLYSTELCWGAFVRDSFSSFHFWKDIWKKKKKNSGSLDTKAVERDEWKEGKECALLSRWCNFFLKCCILPVCHYCYSRCNMADLGTLPVLVKLFTTSENWSLVRAPTLNFTWKEKAEIC